MFDGFLKPKFYSKCKWCSKLTKMRLDTIMKRKNAVQKFLKKDIADLLRGSLDYNAYGRAEGLYVEQNMSSCYELISKYIECILENVRELPKQLECPEECKEAVPSLIYAAARFSDLPELRDLRTLFTDKYANSLEPHLSKELVQKLRQDPPSKERKIQLLRDVVQEFAIAWDSKALEQRLYSPPPSLVLLDDQVTFGEGRKGIMMSDDDETSTDNSSSKAYSSSLGSVSEDNEEVESKMPFLDRLVPPPYVKQLVESNNYLKDKTSEPEKKESKHNNKAVARSVRTRPRNPPPGYDDDHWVKNIRRSISSTIPMTVRGTSVPSASASASERDTITRASSLHAHVHPSLPDYDDLSALLAALRAK